MIAVHLNAGNDKNGNPRRLYVIFDADANAVAVVDEGYQGKGALKVAGWEGVPVTSTIMTTPAHYRELRRMAGFKVPAKPDEVVYEPLKGGREWTVVVGNIGTVYSGPDEVEARRRWEEYTKQSESGYGRAAGEDVTLLVDGVVAKEYSERKWERS